MKENNFLFLHRTNATVSMPQCIFLMFKRRLNHKYSKGHKEKILEQSAKLTAKQETEAFKKVYYKENKQKKTTTTTAAVAIGMPTEVE